MQTTMDAQDADPVASTAAPAPVRRRPFVMTANIPGGDDRKRQSRSRGRAHPPSPPRARGGSGGAMPQTFHQHVNHDESGDDVASDRRLLLAAMVGLAPAITLEAFAGVVVN